MKLLYAIPVAFFILLLFHPQVNAQNQEKIDSLLDELKTLPNDTIRVRTYQHLSSYYSQNFSEPDRARKYADSSISLSSNLKFEEGVAYAHLQYGHLDKMAGNFQSAIQHIDSAILFYVKLGDSSRVADGLYDLASINKAMGNYKKSLSYYHRVLDISKWEENETSIASTLHSIAGVYRRLKQYDEAIERYNEALAILEKLDKKKRKAVSLHGLGEVYRDQQELSLAKKNFERALKINKELGLERDMAYQLAALGHVLTALGDHNQALKFQLQALNIREKISRKEDLALSLRNVGEAYLQLKRYSTSRRYITQGLSLSKELGAKPLISNFYKILSDLSVAEDNYKQAYDFHSLYFITKDSILNEESSKQIAELQTKYETAEKDKQIALLAKEKEVEQKETQRQAAIKKASFGGIGLIALLAGLLVYTLFQRLKNQKIVASKNDEVKEANFKRQLTELEMKALQAQINPHFIFNCMNSINQMILENDNQNASKYLTKFSKLIRLVLENAEEPEVSLKDELAMLEAYIQLEALRFNGEIQYQIKIKENVDPENTYMPSMVLQPFVENAIWHGLMPKKEAGDGLITISINQDQEQLVCQIEDNGVGREKALELQQKSVWKTKSLGLKITEERLKLISQELQKQLIRITDLKDTVGKALGTRVEVSIPTT